MFVVRMTKRGHERAAYLKRWDPPRFVFGPSRAFALELDGTEAVAAVQALREAQRDPTIRYATEGA